MHDPWKGLKPEFCSDELKLLAYFENSCTYIKTKMRFKRRELSNYVQNEVGFPPYLK